MIRLVRAIAGLILWSAAFATLYALEGLGCALGWTDVPLAGLSLFRVLLLGVWATFIAAHLGLLAVFASNRWGATEHFWRRFELAIAAVGLLATLWTLFPAGLMTACEQG